MFDFLKAGILGIIEGLTEFLPVSSTGHLIIANEFISFSESFTKLFDVFIQLGAILAVIVVYRKRLLPNKLNPPKPWFIGWTKVIVGFLPFLVVGFLFGESVQDKLFNPLVVAAALAFWGIVIIVFDRIRPASRIESLDGLGYGRALLIGLWQCLAIVPGTSRSAVTIIGGTLLGLSRVAAVEFSFFLAVPSLAAASAYVIMKNGLSMTGTEAALLATGFSVSFLVAWAVIKLFIGFIQKRGFRAFGAYRIALAAAVAVYFFLIK
jgi:undecaprenyl-diphosphatase